MIRFLVAAVFAASFIVPFQVQAQQAGVDKLVECVSDRAGPEGDLPPAGALRDKMLAAMAKGPFSCIGTLSQACAAAGGDVQDCRKREVRAWLAALKLDKDSSRGNEKVYAAGIAAIQRQAALLCTSAASVSAWGADMVKNKSFKIDTGHPCMLDAIGGMVVPVLVHMRGN